MSGFKPYPAYKDSGGEWIGDIPDHWSASPIKRAFKVEGGSTPSPDAVNWDGEIDWVTPADLSGLTSLFLDASKRTITSAGLASCGTTLLPAGTLILSTRAPIGSLAIALVNMCTNQGCKGLVPNAEASAIYFAYVLLTAKDELNNRGRGSTFLEISGDELGRFSVPMPPRAEQTQIARFLDHETARIDALIAEQQRMIELLKEKRKAVISHAVTKGLDPTVPMKDSGVEWLGEVPEHWRVITAKRLFDNVRVLARPDAEQLAATQEYGVIPQKEFMERNGSKVVLALSGTENFRDVRVNDFVISLRSFQGGIEHSAYDGCVSPAYTVLRHRGHENIEPFYFKYLLKESSYVSELNSVTTGIREGRTISYQQFGSLFIPVAPAVEQTQIAQFLDKETARIDTLINDQQQMISLLKEKRQALISAAVTGKIDVRNA